jgi:hypothetical protein
MASLDLRQTLRPQIHKSLSAIVINDQRSKTVVAAEEKGETFTVSVFPPQVRGNDNTKISAVV